MNTLALSLTSLIVGICLSLPSQAQTTSGGQPQGSAPKDSIQIEVETNAQGKDKTFKLLPKFDKKRDTSGLKLIPKYYEDGNPNTVPLDREPQIVKTVEPEYPVAALQAGLEGVVIVKMWVDDGWESRKGCRSEE